MTSLTRVPGKRAQGTPARGSAERRGRTRGPEGCAQAGEGDRGVAEGDEIPGGGDRTPAHGDGTTRTATSRTTTLRRGLLVTASWLVVLAVTWLVPDVPDLSPLAGRTAFLAVLGGVVLAVSVWLALALSVPGAAARLLHWSWWYVAVAAWFVIWEVTTAKTGWLRAPHFAPPETLLSDFWEDRGLLWGSFWASTRLLLVGFAVGAVSGFFTGLAMGWSRVANYWIHPVLQSIGPVPAGTLLPLVFVVIPTPQLGSIFMIAFGVWFPMAVLTRAGIASVARGYFDVAQTLGAKGRFLVWRVAIPGALPSIFTGLFMGLGASLGALALAELLGVRSGLGWYISWVKGWADYPKMYVAILIMVLLCRTLIVLLFRVRNSVLSWEKDLVRW
ncbi:ABC transporter permease [Oerskovia sp. NPDC056781]|uniref:ABC transporter permease n=1 Tax=Oerskovia sp. NPDC056781 TaxID=3345942 RepID=UPI003670C1AF